MKAARAAPPSRDVGPSSNLARPAPQPHDSMPNPFPQALARRGAAVGCLGRDSTLRGGSGRIATDDRRTDRPPTALPLQTHHPTGCRRSIDPAAPTPQPTSPPSLTESNPNYTDRPWSRPPPPSRRPPTSAARSARAARAALRSSAAALSATPARPAGKWVVGMN